MSPAEGSSPGQDSGSKQSREQGSKAVSGQERPRGTAQRGVNAGCLLTPALAPARQIYRPQEGKAGPGQSQGLAQAPREKTKQEAAITPALALLRQLWLGLVPAVPAMPEPGGDTSQCLLPASPCSAPQWDPRPLGPHPVLPQPFSSR